MSVEELGEYVEALKAEIVRADAEIAKKKPMPRRRLLLQNISMTESSLP